MCSSGSSLQVPTLWSSPKNLPKYRGLGTPREIQVPIEQPRAPHTSPLSFSWVATLDVHFEPFFVEARSNICWFLVVVVVVGGGGESTRNLTKLLGDVS